MASTTSSRAARGLAWVLAASACGSPGAPPPEPPAPPAAPPAAVQAIATARGDRIAVFRRPGDASPATTLDSPNAYGAARAFLVERAEGGWLHVLLPTRPNGSKGWVRAADVTVGTTTKRVEIKAFAFTVYDGDRVVRTGKAAVGTGGTPTPPGRYYFTELVRPRNPDGPTGRTRSGSAAIRRCSTTSPGATASWRSTARTCREGSAPGSATDVSASATTTSRGWPGTSRSAHPC